MGIGAKAFSSNTSSAVANTPLLLGAANVSGMAHSDVGAMLVTSSNLSNSMQLELLGQTGLRTVLLNTKNVAAKGVGLGMTLGTMRSARSLPPAHNALMTETCTCTYVKHVAPHTPAHAAGIQAGDRIMSIMSLRSSPAGLFLL